MPFEKTDYYRCKIVIEIVFEGIESACVQFFPLQKGDSSLLFSDGLAQNRNNIPIRIVGTYSLERFK